MAAASKPRRPLEAIPANYVCPDCGKGPFKNEHAFRGHMSGKHRILYESRQKTPQQAYKLAKLKKLEAREFNEITDLEPWMKLCLARMTLYGVSKQQALDSIRDGKGKDTFNQVAKSPAALAYIELIEKSCDDIGLVVGSLMRDSMLDIYAGWVLSFQAAVESRDHKLVHAMARDIGLKPALAQFSDSAPTTPATIVINLGSNDLASPEVKTSYEALDAEIDDDTDL